ncbi:unnamed protein product [Sphagnum tenellum]
MDAVVRNSGTRMINWTTARSLLRSGTPSTSFSSNHSGLQLLSSFKILETSNNILKSKSAEEWTDPMPVRRRTLSTPAITGSVHEIAEVNGIQYEGSSSSKPGGKKKNKGGEMSSKAISTQNRPTSFELHSKYSGLNAVLGALAGLALVAEKHLRSEQQLAVENTDPSRLGSFRQGRLIEDRRVYRQTFVIRSYEVGVDKAASIDTFMNHLQETALNHVWMSGLAGDGFGATHEMIRNDLIWVVACMCIEVDAYPAWGDVVEVDTWVAASGKSGMRRDWLVRDCKTGQIISRATSTWVTMNQITRRLSKMPDEVRTEIAPFHFERFAMKNQNTVMQKIDRLEDTAQFVHSGLTPKRGDLDMNQHVNNVKYVGWVMESVPVAVFENYELSSMTLKYRRECGQSDVLQSMCSPTSCTAELEKEAEVEVNGSGCSYTAGSQTSIPDLAKCVPPHLQFTHLLRLQVDGAEILRGKTQWRLKKSKHLH